MTKFKIGDLIRNKKPYDGESSYMIMEINTKFNDYRCAMMRGKYCSKPDFYNRMILPFDDAHNYYERVDKMRKEKLEKILMN